MKIDHGRVDRTMAKERLHFRHRVAIFDQMGGERVAQSVGMNIFADTSFQGSGLDDSADGTGADVVAVIPRK